MFKYILLVFIMFISVPAFALDGAHVGYTCTGATLTGVPEIRPGDVLSWCPSTTTTQMIRSVKDIDCNWDGDPANSPAAGVVTLGVKKCSGTTATACDTPMVDSLGAAWVVTSDDSKGRFSLDSGTYLITASPGVTATGRLLCTGR